MTTQLGFIEDIHGTLKPDLSNFPCKVGGKPIWLNPHHVLNADRASCGTCGKPMPLLLQIYTPEKEPLDAYHRCIYLFCCKTGACHKTNWRTAFNVFRSQLSQTNEFYDANNQVIGDTAKICYVCGLAGTKQCARCHAVSYCSKDHQVFHWTIGKHKQLCAPSPRDSEDLSTLTKNAKPKMQKEDTQIVKKHLFTEYELVIEAEPDGAMNALVDGVNSMDVDRNGNSKESLAMVPFAQEQYEEAFVDVDKAFLKFQKKIRVEPNQVLRYCRVTESPANPIPPLWVSDSNIPSCTDVLPCSYCHSPRAFEFQVMPQLLNYFKFIDHFDINALDWGTIAIYTCPQNCSFKSHSRGLDQYYAEEVVWRQMFSEHGVADRFKQMTNDQTRSKEQ